MGQDDLARQNRKINLLIAAGVVVIVACLATVGYLVWQKRSSNSGETETSRQTQQVIDEVGGLYLLPENDTPTVARLTDKSKLQSGQSFYEKAQNGDYVLVFNKSRLAMLYRQSAHKLVFVSQVTTNNPADPEAK